MWVRLNISCRVFVEKVYLRFPSRFYCAIFIYAIFSWCPFCISKFTKVAPLSCIGEGNGNPLQCSCLENPRDGGAWWAAVHGVAQSRTRLKQLSSSSSSKVAQTVKCRPAMRETQVRSLGPEDTLAKEMATHSSTLAGKIPCTEEPCRLQSMGSQRVRHDWATSLTYLLILTGVRW